MINDEIKKLDIENRLKNLLYRDNENELSIGWGMNYIFFSPSKRVRPLLLLESNLIFSEIDDDAYVLASVVELIHTYSLVHDDLPCMDNDDLRRGQKTLHVLKNEAYALLVGDSLLTAVFGILSKYGKPEKTGRILDYIHRKAGENGMIYGQYLDMEAENSGRSAENILELNHNKTGKLLELCLALGAINGNACEEDINNMENLGGLFGHIFQLQDDILDIIGAQDVLGKKTGSDQLNNKSSIPIMLGIEKTRDMIEQYRIDVLELVDKLPDNREFFYKFTDFLINRQK